MEAAEYRLMTEATGQRIAAALEAISGTGAAAAAARANLDVYSKGETDNAIEQSTATRTITLTSLTPVDSTDGYNRCVVSGNIGMISISAVITSASSAWQRVFDLSDSVGPKYDVYFALVDTTDANNIGCAYISTDGVYVKTTIDNKKVRGFCTWIIGQ